MHLMTRVRGKPQDSRADRGGMSIYWFGILLRVWWSRIEIAAIVTKRGEGGGGFMRQGDQWHRCAPLIDGNSDSTQMEGEMLRRYQWHLRPNVLPRCPVRHETHLKINRIQSTYVPYCEEDERHAENQRQHIAEGSKSEHNWPRKTTGNSPGKKRAPI